MNAETQVKLAARLYEMRDSAKTFLGAHYKGRMDVCGAVLRQMAEAQGKSVLEAATILCKESGVGPTTIILIMAAAVELIEPSTGAAS